MKYSYNRGIFNRLSSDYLANRKQLLDHDTKGKAVVLTSDEIDLLLSAAKDNRQRIAFGLGARCGLRSHEITGIRPVDVVDGPAGSMIKVKHGKGEKYRETPLPKELKTTIEVYAEQRDVPIDQPLFDVLERNKNSSQLGVNWLLVANFRLIAIEHSLGSPRGDESGSVLRAVRYPM